LTLGGRPDNSWPRALADLATEAVI
jgi:hypothetical protein